MNYSIRYCQNGCYRVFFFIIIKYAFELSSINLFIKTIAIEILKKPHLMLLFYYCREQMFENVSNINYLYINKFLDL